jgi:hypothetical protein
MTIYCNISQYKNIAIKYIDGGNYLYRWRKLLQYNILMASDIATNILLTGDIAIQNILMV